MKRTQHHTESKPRNAHISPLQASLSWVLLKEPEPWECPGPPTPTMPFPWFQLLPRWAPTTAWLKPLTFRVWLGDCPAEGGSQQRFRAGVWRDLYSRWLHNQKAQLFAGRGFWVWLDSAQPQGHRKLNPLVAVQLVNSLRPPEFGCNFGKGLPLAKHTREYGVSWAWYYISCDPLNRFQYLLIYHKHHFISAW